MNTTLDEIVLFLCVFNALMNVMILYKANGILYEVKDVLFTLLHK